MNRRRRTLVHFAVGSLIMLALWLPTWASPSSGQRPGPSGPQATVDVSMQNIAFVPSTVTINVNDTVVWTNNEASAIPHTTTSDTGVSPPWDSGIMNPGDTFSFTFTQAGTFTYHCSVHPLTMVGTVNVVDAPTATNTRTPTPSSTPQPTNTRTPTNTNTPVPTATNTPSPTSTGTTQPTNTRTPTNTSTPVPTATNTPSPTSTGTTQPTNTNTPVPTATNTPPPTSTGTAQPTNTNTPVSTATSTLPPTSTGTPQPTDTPVVTATNTPTPIDTAEPTPTPTSSPTPVATETRRPPLTLITRLHPAGRSEVHGVVNLVGRPGDGGGTDIRVLAVGLAPEESYLAQTHENSTCRPSDPAGEDVIGDMFMGNPRGFGRTDGHVEGNLDSIGSVSVRRASDHKLVACAQVHLPHGHHRPLR